jgi:TonB family protein
MGLMTVAAVAAAVLAAGALAEAGELSRRDADQKVLNYYPEAARQAGVQGAARLSCGRTVHAAMRDCVLTGEWPKGYDFGAAALKLAGFWRENPRAWATPVASGAPVTFLFCAHPPIITPNPFLEPHVVVEPAILEAPPPAKVARAFPLEALNQEVTGRVLLRCTVTEGGRLEGCQVERETPEGHGFGGAALSLTDSYRMRPRTVDGRIVGGARVILPVTFGEAPPEPPPAADPSPQTPDALCRAVAARMSR